MMVSVAVMPVLQATWNDNVVGLINWLESFIGGTVALVDDLVFC
jgi:hypothetical protein